MDAEQMATVDRVVDIALDLFTTRGYAGTALREVADAVGFSKAALYHHFPTKAALLDEMLSPLIAAIDDLLAEPIPECGLDLDRAQLLAGMLGIVFAHRREAAVLFGDRAVRKLEPGRTWAAQQRALVRRLSGPRARVMTQIQVRSALTLVFQPATSLFSVSEHVLRRPLLQIALETCTGADRRGT